MSTSRSTLDREFSQIQDNILRMGSLVETAIDNSTRALKTRDLTLAKQIIADDQIVNNLRFATEEECMALIATQQPMASDLRAVISAMNIVNDMERMGDHARGIARTVLRMGDEPIFMSVIEDIPRMADLARAMLKQALDAYLARDAALARSVAERDDEIDHLYNHIFSQILAAMVANPKATTAGTYLLWAGHNLERIGDRITNVAERVIYMTTGTMQELNL